MVRRAFVAVMALPILAGGAAGQVQTPSRGAESAAPTRQLEPGPAIGELPLLRVHRYRMDGRVRPLLFWIGRGDVGTGEIVWRGGDGGVAYELLIGTDAAKAPRGINRWGYLLEDSRPSGTRVLGVITTSDEATISDVTSQPAGARKTGRFRGLDARISAGLSRSATETLETERDFSIRDKTIIVGRLEERLKEAEVREFPIPQGVRQGFLLAVAELVSETIEARKAGEEALRRLKSRTIPYVYSRRLYDLSLTDVKAMRPPAGAPPGGAQIHAEFSTLNRSSGSRTSFELEYDTDGPLAGVPTLIRHRPRWWLEAVLKLQDAAPPGAPKDGARLTPRPTGQ